MSSVHIHKSAVKLMFGRFTRKGFREMMFEEAARENPVVREVLKPLDFGLKHKL